MDFAYLNVTAGNKRNMLSKSTPNLADIDIDDDDSMRLSLVHLRQTFTTNSMAL
jgi:hypothetical protein